MDIVIQLFSFLITFPKEMWPSPSSSLVHIYLSLLHNLSLEVFKLSFKILQRFFAPYPSALAATPALPPTGAVRLAAAKPVETPRQDQEADFLARSLSSRFLKLQSCLSLGKLKYHYMM